MKLLKANWNNERIILERNIERHYPNMIAHCEEKIISLEKDITLKNKFMSEEFLMCIDGKTFDERVKAGERLIMMSRLHNISVNGEPLEVGDYRGFKLLLARTAFDHLLSLSST